MIVIQCPNCGEIVDEVASPEEIKESGFHAVDEEFEPVQEVFLTCMGCGEEVNVTTTINWREYDRAE